MKRRPSYAEMKAAGKRMYSGKQYGKRLFVLSDYNGLAPCAPLIMLNGFGLDCLNNYSNMAHLMSARRLFY